MSNKINARLQHKIDTQENWEKATNFIPLKGELIIYDIDANNASRRIKIGDGITPVNDLEFVSAQSDEEQNDSSKSDYIKNRTHYKEVIHQERVDLLPATEIDFPSLGEMGYTQTEPLNIQAGDTVKVLWDNQEYQCVAQSAATVDPQGHSGLPSDGIVFGNLYYAFEVDRDSRDIPFLVLANYTISEQEGFIPGCIIMSTSELTNPITVNIFTGGDKVVYHKLDLNYLPLYNSNISEEDDAIISLKYLRANQSDWEINDRDDPRFIKNRPCYKSLWGTSVDSLINTTITLDVNGIYTSQEQLYDFKYIWNNSEGDISLTVHWHDGTYNCILRELYAEWTNEQGEYQNCNYFAFGNVSDINYDYSSDSAPFLIYTNYNPETNKTGETYIKAYDGFTGELTLQVGAEYRYWGYYTLDNRYLNISSLQADWDEENRSAPSYINNKPFYKYKIRNESGIGSISINLVFNDNSVCINRNPFFNLNKFFNEHEPVNGNNVFAKCTWNGTEYKCKVRHLSCEYYDSNKGSNIVDYYYAFGNVSSINSEYSDTAPFLVYANYNPETHQYGETYIISNDGSTGTIPFEASWVYDYWGYQTLDNRYLNLTESVSENNEDPVTSGAVYKAIKSNSGSGGSFYITLTQDSEGNYTTDKTFAETLTAYNKGKSLYMIYSDYILPLVQKTNSSIFIFSCLKDFTSSADKTAASLSYLSLYFSEGGVSVHSDSTNKFIDDRQKGAAKGIATLDENVKIPVAQIPDEIARMENVNTAIQSAIGNALGGSY